MNSGKAFFGLLTILLSSAVQAESKSFEVVATVSGCKYFVVEQGFDHVLVEEWMCSRPRRRDEGTGDLGSYGLKTVKLDGSTCDVYVDDYMLSKRRAIEKLESKCK